MTDDVQPAYRFLVTLDPSDAFIPPDLITIALEFAPGAFQTATGLGAELEVTSYPEGGRNDYAHQLPLRPSWRELNAEQDAVAIDSLEIAHEGLQSIPGLGLVGL